MFLSYLDIVILLSQTSKNKLLAREEISQHQT